MAIFNRKRAAKSKSILKNDENASEHTETPKERKPLGEMMASETLDFSPISAFEMSSVVYANSGLIESEDSDVNYVPTQVDHSFPASFPASFPDFDVPPSNSRAHSDIGVSNRKKANREQREEKENISRGKSQPSPRTSSTITPKNEILNINDKETDDVSDVDNSAQSDNSDTDANNIFKRAAPESVYTLKSLMDGLSDSEEKSSQGSTHGDGEDEDFESNKKNGENDSRQAPNDKWVRSYSPETGTTGTRSCPAVKDNKQQSKQQTLGKYTDGGRLLLLSGCVGDSMERVEDTVLHITKECDKLAHAAFGGKHEWLWT